jgi:leukotriene-A4 hydrolase
VPYEKGRLFLGWLESRVGREDFDAFLRAYFDTFAFQSISTEAFRTFLDSNLLAKYPDKVTGAEIDIWINDPGVPKFAVLPQSDSFTRLDTMRTEWLGGKTTVEGLGAGEWTTQEWLHFLDGFPRRVAASRLRDLDAAYKLTQTGNNEIAHSWLRIAIRNSYEPAYERLATYLQTIGRRKLIRPLYEDLMKTPAGAARAREIYRLARPNYHPIAAATIDGIVLGSRAN